MMRAGTGSKVSRRRFLGTAPLAGAGLALPSLLKPAAARGYGQPNIIFILADDLGYGDLGCYGQRVIKTPNIDRLAAEGIRFTQCYSGSTVCAPSRCSLMTGLHTGHCRIRGNLRIPLEPGDVTVPKVLAEAGYTTGLIGKWGLGNEGTPGIPNLQGFDDFLGYLDQKKAHDYYPERIWDGVEETVLMKNVGGGRGTYSHDLFASAAFEWAHGKREEPFFLYLAYTIPHANNERGQLEGNGMEVPDYGPYKDMDWPDAEKGKAAMITRMDRDIGSLLATLEDSDIDEDTLIFFSSDNGPHKEGGSNPNFFKSSGLLRGIKRDLYEGGIRVPMIVRWPRRTPAGSVSDQVWAFWDFLPTMAGLAGVPAPGGLDGQSILPALLGEEVAPHEFLYWEFHEGGFKQAVRMGDWKAVRPGLGQPLELYNLVDDLGENQDVAKQNPEIVARIEGYLRTARTDSPHWPIKS